MDKNPKLRVRDRQTNETWSVSWDNTVYVTTQDGVKVKLHPLTIRVFVPVGNGFDGQTLLGPRPMVRVQ